MSGSIAFVDGALLPRDEATVSIDDAAVRYGAACFETMRATNAHVFRLAAHLERLRAGIEAMGVQPPPAVTLEAAIAATLEVNGLTEVRVRLSVSAGRMTGPDLTAAGAPSIVVIADPVAPEPAPRLTLAVASIRIDPGRPLAFAKTAQYLGYLLARAEARSAGADDALLLNTAGEACETSSANFFAVSDGCLRTPALTAGPLPGVTRSVILEIAARDGIVVEEGPVVPSELAAVEEVFVTNSIVGAQSVTSIVDGERVLWTGSGAAATTTHLAGEYARLVIAESGGGESDG